MAQSTNRCHVGIVMDGNGRWAAKRGLPRTVGHQAGAVALRRIVEAAPGLGIGTLTLYAFSADNWRRPLPEVSHLMHLLGRYLATETDRLAGHGVALNVIGRRDRLSAALVRSIERAEAATEGGETLLLRIAVDYSGRAAIRRAALRAAEDESDESFGRLVAEVDHGRRDPGPADLIVRTGGEQRLSDFLLWDAAYAELVFRRELWPDFLPADLAEALAEFRGRVRRFGGLEAAPPALTLHREGAR